MFGAAADRHVILISIDGFPAQYWREPAMALPTLRKLAVEGAVADAMTVVDPSVTWINHTTLITGVTPRKHGVLFNGLLTRQGPDKPPKVVTTAAKRELIAVPALDDVVHAAGLTAAESAWPALEGSAAISWSFPEIPKKTGALEREMFAAGAMTEQEIGWMQLPGRKNVPWLDEAWTRAACYIFKQHRPNLLMLHIANVDFIHHRFGPGSAPGYTALAYADRLIGDIVRTVEESGLRDRTTFVITTDHGFKKVQRFLFLNVVLKQAGLLRSAGPTVTQCDAYVVTQGGTASVFVGDPARKAELLPRLRELFRATEGVAQVLEGRDGPSVGMPTPEENQGVGDLVLFAKAGYWFTSNVTGDALTGPAVEWFGAHGYPAKDPEMDGIFIASGAGVQRGVRLNQVRNLDVAPTIAHLLGVKMPTADGMVLRAILESGK